MSDEIGIPPMRASGWYPSPTSRGYGEYWDGDRWTGLIRADVSVSPDEPIAMHPADAPALLPATPKTTPTLSASTWLGIILGGGWLLISLATSGFSGLLVGAGTLALFTAIYTVVSGRRSWLMIPSKSAGVLILAGSLVVCMIGAGMTPRTPESTIVNLAGDSQPSATPSTSATEPSATAKPTVTTKKVIEVQDIPFEQSTVDDPNLAAGTTQVTIPGVTGKRTNTYQVTYTGGVETARTTVSSIVTTAPVTQVTANGTYVAPPAPVAAPAPAPASGCDPNYGGCVPIASDVDCGGGSGDGPAYLYETVAVVGSDIYGLDRDHDGIACD